MSGARKHRPIDFEVLPGLFTEETPRGAFGRWRDGKNVRWRDRLPEKMGGFQPYEITDDNDEETTYIGRARSYHEWDSLDGQNWVAFGTHCKLYLINNGKLYDITPVRRTASLVNAFTTEEDSDLVTVEDVLHDAAEGDHVRFSGGSEVGGITLAGEYTIVEVIDLDHYTVRASTEATSTDTGGGVAVAEYDIPCGLETDGTLRGYGTGDYGEEAYGTERESSTYGAFARVWSLDNWGEDLLASPNGGTLYVWDRTLGPGSRAREVPGAPANIEFMMVGPDDRHVIAFGANTVGTGEQDRMFVRWCAGDNYEEWLATAENDAGSKRLDVGSRLITAIKTRQGILIWSDKGLFGLSVVGGQDVYSIQFLGEAVKIVSKMAAVDVGGTAFFMGEDDFYRWDGALTVIPCEVHSYVFDKTTGLNRGGQSKVHARYIKEFNEIWWDFPAGSSAENNRVAIYNVVERCWYVSDMARECRGDRNPALGYPLGFKDGEVFLHENGVDADDEPLVAFLESFERELEAGDFEMLVSRLVPDFKTLTGSIDVTLFGRNYPAETRRTAGPATVSSATAKVDIRFRARQFGIRVESDALSDHWRMSTWRAFAGPIGAR